MSIARTARLLEATKPVPFADALGVAVADAILAPRLDRMEADLARFRAEVEAAMEGRQS